MTFIKVIFRRHFSILVKRKVSMKNKKVNLISKAMKEMFLLVISKCGLFEIITLI